ADRGPAAAVGGGRHRGCVPPDRLQQTVTGGRKFHPPCHLDDGVDHVLLQWSDRSILEVPSRHVRSLDGLTGAVGGKCAHLALSVPAVSVVGLPRGKCQPVIGGQREVAVHCVGGTREVDVVVAVDGVGAARRLLVHLEQRVVPVGG